jgi:hypothetical protein
MLPLAEGVIIPFVANRLEGEGAGRRFVPTGEIEDGATAMLDALAKTVPVLKRLRS